MIILMILSMVGFKGEYLMNDFKSVQSSQNPTLRLSLLKPEQNQTSYLMENTHPESLGVKTKKRNKLKYVALETAGGMIGGSIAALGLHFAMKSRDYTDPFEEVYCTIVYPIFSYPVGSVFGTYFTGKALKEKGSLFGTFMGELVIGVSFGAVWGLIVNALPIDPYSDAWLAVNLSGIFIAASIGCAIGYNL